MTEQHPAPASVTEDAFLGERLMLLQPKTGYRAGLDAVLLAATVPDVQTNANKLQVADLGAGVGAVGLCIASRLKTARIVLVELEVVLARLAVANADRNGFADRVKVVQGDLAASPETLTAHGVIPETFDHVVANPPFLSEGRGRPPRDELKAAAHVMERGALDHWGRVMARLTKPGGSATMIHRADMLGEVLGTFEGRFGAITVLPLHPRAGESAVRVIIGGIKGSRAPMRISPGLILHEREGHAFTPFVQSILRDGKPLGLR